MTAAALAEVLKRADEEFGAPLSTWRYLTLARALEAKVETLRKALVKAESLIEAIDQTAMGVFQVGGDDPELLVCETAEAVDFALASSLTV